MITRAEMADLQDGVRIRHLRWETSGIVRISDDGTVHVHWEGALVDDEISETGPVQPGDVQIVEVGL
jgi:hypothetical protein